MGAKPEKDSLNPGRLWSPHPTFPRVEELGRGTLGYPLVRRPRSCLRVRSRWRGGRGLEQVGRFHPCQSGSQWAILSLGVELGEGRQ